MNWKQKQMVAVFEEIYADGLRSSDRKQRLTEIDQDVDCHLMHNSISFNRDNHTIWRWVIQSGGGKK